MRGGRRRGRVAGRRAGARPLRHDGARPGARARLPGDGLRAPRRADLRGHLREHERELCPLQGLRVHRRRHPSALLDGAGTGRGRRAGGAGRHLGLAGAAGPAGPQPVAGAAARPSHGRLLHLRRLPRSAPVRHGPDGAGLLALPGGPARHPQLRRLGPGRQPLRDRLRPGGPLARPARRGRPRDLAGRPAPRRRDVRHHGDRARRRRAHAAGGAGQLGGPRRPDAIDGQALLGRHRPQRERRCAAPAVGEPARRPARRLRHRGLRAHLHPARRAAPAARRALARGTRDRALPEGGRQRRQRIGRALRRSLERALPRHTADRGQPEPGGGRPGAPGAARRGGGRAGPARADPRTRPQRARDLARVALPAEARTGAAGHAHPAAPVRAGDRDRAGGEAQAERLRAGGRLQDAQARRRAARASSSAAGSARAAG